MTKVSRSWLFYGLLLIIFIILSYGLIKSGSAFEVEAPVSSVIDASGAKDTRENDWTLFLHAVKHNVGEPFAILLLQLIAILITVRIFGILCVRIGQPTVIGEIIAGIVLGPSLLGYFYPEFFEFLFPAESMSNLEILSQLGLILFMFIIGMELELDELKKKLNETFVISHASIIFPFFFGMILSYFVYQEYAAGMTSFLSFSLFIGISMSITAFPVLARIVQEKGLTKTHLGIVAIASAANNDVSAWCLLAVVIAIAQTGTFVSALYTIGFSMAYILFMFLVVKPFLKRLASIYQNKEVINKGIVAFIFLVLILSSCATQVIGIHALFGAFLAGVIMPASLSFRKILTEKIEDIALVLLLPLFFVYTGLRTEIGLLNTPELWILCVIFITVGVIGKFLGTALPARIVGESWKDSLSLGALMNARGLMELIVLNIGYEMGILPPTIFVILVLMALITTFMTTPALELINRLFPAREASPETYQHLRKKFNILLSFGRPESGRKLLNVAKAVFGNKEEDIIVTALHMTVGTDVNPIHADYYSEEGFEPILDEAKKIYMPVHTEYRVTDDVGREVVEVVNEGEYNFLLVGAGLSSAKEKVFKDRDPHARKGWIVKLLDKINKQGMRFYPGTLLKDKTKLFIEQTDTAVGVFIDRDFSEISSMVVVLYRPEDLYLFEYAESILDNNAQATATILDVNGLITKSPAVIKGIRYFSDRFESRVTLLHKKGLSSDLLSRQNFMLIGYDSWNIISEEYKIALQTMPSTLIIHEKSEPEKE